MVLSQFYFKEFTSLPNTWVLNEFYFNDKVNLLVGKNATGKTRTIDRISALAGMLIGQQQLSLEVINSANFEVSFTNNHDVYIYSLATRNRNIVSEIFSINDVMKLKRFKDGSGTLYYEEENRDIAFKVSDNRPIIMSRRDDIQHPYLEDLFRWADGLRCYYFGSSRDMGQRNMLATVNLEEFSNEEINTHDTFRINELYLRAKKEFGDDFNKKIISFMQEIGYDISDLSLDINPYTAIVEENKSPLYMLCVKENDRNANLYQTGMSQGMFRALSLLIQVTYNIMKKISSTILIDDIGEGLDFERSSKLIKLLIELAEGSDNIQLIMSTNDRFVMNNVPLEYWQVIQRSGGECHVFNYRNRKEKFDEFKYMGLNNFDFLATDYLNSEWKKA
jgi:hypothetical protein